MICIPLLVTAQNKKKHQPFFKRYMFQAQFLNAGIGLPPHIVNGRAQPGFQIAVVKALKRKHGLLPQLGLGYFAHRSLQRAAYFKAGLSYAIPVAHSFFIQPNLNVYGMRIRRSNREFKFINGSYQELDRYSSQVMPSGGIDFVLPINISIVWKYSIICGYEFGVQYPFSALSSTLPIQQLKMGIQLQRK